MENLENSLSEQQENIIPPQEGISLLAKLKTKWPIVLGAFGSLVLFAAIIYAVYSYSKREQEIQPTPSPIVTSPISPTSVGEVNPISDETADWKIYYLSDQNEKPILDITYQLPTNIEEPKCANVGCYYRQTLLPGNSTLAIIPIGEGLGYQGGDWDSIIESVVEKNNYDQQVKFVNSLKVVEFSGELSSVSTSDLNLVTEGYGQFRGFLLRVNSKLSLELIHYQDKFTKESINFSSDEVLFDKIFSTFRFPSNEFPLSLESLVPKDEIVLQKTFPFIPSLRDIVSQTVTDYNAVDKITLEENSQTKMRVLIFFKAARKEAHTFDSITWDWKGTGLASSPCYTNEGFYKDHLGLMVADGNSASVFTNSKADTYGCSTQDEYYVEIIFDTEGFWIPKE